jgi:hypothetical protein
MHFHAICGEHEALIEIETGISIKGGCHAGPAIW